MPRWKLTANTRRVPATRSASSTSAPAGTTTSVPAAIPPTTSTTTLPVSAEEVARQVVVTTTTTAPPPTTTTAPVTAAPSGAVHYGQVTYYDHPAGTCASPWLPFGTVVSVTNPANGETVTCVVNDREADTARSIDLATDTFAEIAPLSQGVIDAELSW